MIFVTVGTHEQPFNRLVQFVDEMKKNGEIQEEVVIQTGYCTYEPQYCTWKNLFTYKEMEEHIAKARIVVTHGGPSSFIMPLQVGKIPIVVPRRKEFDEHVNDHQFEFCQAVSERMGTILFVKDVEALREAITNYDSFIAEMPSEMKSNNESFNEELSNVVDGLFKNR